MKSGTFVQNVLDKFIVTGKFLSGATMQFLHDVPLFTFTISKALPRDTASPDSAFFVLVEIIFGETGKA